MGWVLDGHEEHEGWIVGFVAERRADLDSSWLRELSAAQGDASDRNDLVGVGAACDCGWRSRRLAVYTYDGSSRVVFRPYVVESRDPVPRDQPASLAPAVAFLPGHGGALTWAELQEHLAAQWRAHVEHDHADYGAS